MVGRLFLICLISLFPSVGFSQVSSKLHIKRFLSQLGHTGPVTLHTTSTIHDIPCDTFCTIDWRGKRAYCDFRSLQPDIAEFKLKVPGSLEFRPPDRVLFKARYVNAALLFRFDRTQKRMIFVRGFGGGEGMTWQPFDLTSFVLNDSLDSRRRIRR